MCVHHRGTNVPVAQQLLHKANVVPVLQKVRRKGVPERVWRYVVRDPRPASRVDRPLNVPLYPHCVGSYPVLTVIPGAQPPASLTALLSSRSRARPFLRGYLLVA